MLWRRAAKGPTQLLLHVGRHKTGSTSLQQVLAQAQLSPYGILYPRAGQVHCQHAGFPAALLSSGQSGAAVPEMAEAEVRIASLLAALEQEVRIARPRLILLSSEVFCELAKRRPEGCAWLLAQLASRWPLQLLQVVRPLPDSFLSALRHQLRAGTFATRSPFSWYRHCRRKTQILDAFWLACGHPVISLPYSPADSTRPVIEAVADRAALHPRQRRRLLAQLPVLRANAGHRNAALVALYVVYLVRARAWQAEPSGVEAASSLLPLAAFEAALAAADPAFVQGLRSHPVGDRELLELCRERDREAGEGVASDAIWPGDSPADRLDDWRYLSQSACYRQLSAELAQACHLLALPQPEG